MDRTYKMIGGDGREDGPAVRAELLGWVREGRVAPMTPVWRSDEERWTPAGEVRELEDELEKLPPFHDAQAAVAPAGFWVRFAAHLIDQFLLALVIPLIVAPPKFPPG